MTNFSFKPNLLLIDATRDKLHLELMHHGPTGGDDGNIGSTKNLQNIVHEVNFVYLNEILLKEIHTFLNQHGMVLGDIQVLAINHGPGSYNGIRISVVVAKTIAFFQKIPIYPFDGFMVMEAWRQDPAYRKLLKKLPTSYGPLEGNILNVMVLNPSRDIFFLALYVGENGKGKQLGKIIPFGKTTKNQVNLLRSWLPSKAVNNKNTNSNFVFQNIADLFKLTNDESLLLETPSSAATTAVTNVKWQPVIRWFFFNETSYQNLVAFIDEKPEGKLVQEKIVWDTIFQHRDDVAMASSQKIKRSYQPVIKMALENSTGKVMEVTPHYCRNFGE